VSANGKNIGGGKPDSQWSQVPPIVPGQEIYTQEQFRLLLGGISESYYYELRDKKKLFKFSRLGKGLKVVHTRQQYLDYVEYLNTEGVVAPKSEIQEFKDKKAARG
jgi:hypothetical protein